MERFEPPVLVLTQQGALPPGSTVPSGGAQGDATQTATGASPGSTSASPSAWGSPLFLFGILFLFMWFFVIRPERRRQKERGSMLASLQKGDEVVTTGGMLGQVVRMEEGTITLKVDENVRLKFDRNAIARITSPKGQGGAAADAKDGAKKALAGAGK